MFITAILVYLAYKCGVFLLAKWSRYDHYVVGCINGSPSYCSAFYAKENADTFKLSVLIIFMLPKRQRKHAFEVFNSSMVVKINRPLALRLFSIQKSLPISPYSYRFLFLLRLYQIFLHQIQKKVSWFLTLKTRTPSIFI